MPEGPAANNPTVNLGGGAGGDDSKRAVASVRARFSVDTTGVRKLRDEFKKLNEELSKTSKFLSSISGVGATGGEDAVARGSATASRNASGQGGAAGGGGGGLISSFLGRIGFGGGFGGRGGGVGTSIPGGPLPPPPPGAAPGAPGDPSATSGIWAKAQMVMRGGPGGMPQISPKMAGGIAAGAAVLQVAGKAAAALENRLETAQDYVLAANKTTMVGQLRGYGDRLTIDRAVRAPLANLLLGPREDQGPTRIQAFQQRFGGDAMQIGRGVESMRISSGFQLTTGDVLQRQEALMQPGVNNLMQQRLGTGAYGFGGKQKSVQQVYEDVIRRTNFSKRQWEGGRQPGSNLRAFLTNSGVPPDMIDDVINLALQNFAFQDKIKTSTPEQLKGLSKREREFFRGSGDQNKLMGISGEFPMQREKRFQSEVERDEDLNRRQSDNYAAAEVHLRKMNSLFGALEDHTSGLIGAFMRLNSIMGGGKGGKGGAAGALMGAGAGATLGFMVGGPFGAVIGGIGGGLLGMFGGDPVSGDRNMGSSAVENRSGDPWHDPPAAPGAPWEGGGGHGGNGWTGLTQTMKSRLDKMLQAAWAEGRRVWLGQGKRTEEQQKRMFLKRYRRTNKKTKTQWDGSYWEHVSGAAAAPPGRSMHEIGLAADLTGDMKWVTANAHRFGLKHFANVNNEPWHVQPTELPNSRREYEGQGGGGEDLGVPESLGDNSEQTEQGHGEGGGGGAGSMGTTSIGADLGISGMSFGGNAGGGGGGGGGGESKEVSTSTMTTAYPRGGKMAGADVAKLLYKAGFRGQDLVNMVGIAHRESRWNAGALNPNTANQDMSFGLFQINMLGQMGVDRRKFLGLSSNEDLYDPWTNVLSAKKLFDAALKKTGTGYYGWGPYKNASPFRNVNFELARAAVHEAGLGGDPDSGGYTTRASSPASTMSSATINSTPISVSVAPVFNITVQQLNDAEAQRFGKKVAAIAKDEIALAMSRSN